MTTVSCFGLGAPSQQLVAFATLVCLFAGVQEYGMAICSKVSEPCFARSSLSIARFSVALLRCLRINITVHQKGKGSASKKTLQALLKMTQATKGGGCRPLGHQQSKRGGCRQDRRRRLGAHPIHPRTRPPRPRTTAAPCPHAKDDMVSPAPRPDNHVEAGTSPYPDEAHEWQFDRDLQCG